jgi:hypothetical protein
MSESGEFCLMHRGRVLPAPEALPLIEELFSRAGTDGRPSSPNENPADSTKADTPADSHEWRRQVVGMLDLATEARQRAKETSNAEDFNTYVHASLRLLQFVYCQGSETFAFREDPLP